MANVETKSRLEILGDDVTEKLNDVLDNPESYSKEEVNDIIEIMENFMNWYDEKVKDRPELQA